METARGWEHAWEEARRQVGVGPRAVAAVIDAIASLLLLGLPLTLVLGDKSTAADATGTTTFWYMNGSLFLLWVALTLAYFVVFETLFGATIGKLILNLRVRSSDGGPIDLEAALLRNLLRIVDCFPYVIPYLLGALAIWAGDDRQRLGDRLADTIVTSR